jgi:hypothetical protein
MTLEHRRLAMSNFAHDLDGAVAVGAQSDLGARDVRHHAQGPLATAAFRREGQSGITIRNFDG